ncbi:hypothetical protein V6N13_010775 [Hibiscus sabdariffa]|uniref:Uncharacterized protein n=1 Tax=Hibiscus sabdariffa TaxID=183260 RepID=A0ABR2SAA6_9ROSI
MSSFHLTQCDLQQKLCLSSLKLADDFAESFGSYCNDRRDLDLCRDSALLADEWCCAVPQCGQGYDWEMMENKLLQTIRQRENCIICEIQCAVRCRQVKAMWVCRLV